MSGIFIQAIGVNNAMGSGLHEISKNLFSGESSFLVQHQNLNSGHSCYVGKVNKDLPPVPDNLNHLKSRNNQLLIEAYEQISEQTEKLIKKYGSKKFGIVMGTSTSGIAEAEEAIKNDFLDYEYRRQEIGGPSEFMKEYIGAGSVAYTVSTACSSSGRSILSAVRLIQAGICDVVLAGGSDSLCSLTLNGFDSLSSISDQPCNPLSENRNGISIGEGAALFLLSKDSAEIEIIGFGDSSDGYHISSPDPEAAGAELALREALKTADLDEVGYVNLHGTATPKNDEMEAKLVHRVLGSEVPVSSTKGLIGHCLGAAAAQELAFSYITLSEELNPHHYLPPQVWDGHLDPQLHKIHVVKPGERWTKASVMSNSFAFGGNNISLIIGRA